MCDNILATYTAKIDGRSLGNAEMRCFLLIKSTIFPNASAVANRTCIHKKDLPDKRIPTLESAIWYRV